MRRVVITGLGVAAPNGTGKEQFWKSTCEGRSGVGRISSFDPSTYPVQIAAEVKDFDVTEYLPNPMRKSLRTMGRATQLGVAAAAMALKDSGFDTTAGDPERFGVAMGTGLVPYDFSGFANSLAHAATEQ